MPTPLRRGGRLVALSPTPICSDPSVYAYLALLSRRCHHHLISQAAVELREREVGIDGQR